MPYNSDLVSVIVPTYNMQRHLGQCLTSITAQGHRELQIICVNDGSTDDSLAIMTKHAKADSRIIVIDKPNEGYGASCNRGIALAEGEWVSVIEPDDWIEPGMYAAMLECRAKYADDGIDVIKTPYWRIQDSEPQRARRLNCSYRHRVRPPAQPFRIAEAAHLLSHHPSIWSALYRRGFLEKNGIRFRPIPGAGWADNPFLIESMLKAQGIIYLDLPFYCYREDTPEKAADFARRSPLIPFERWMDMMDVIESLGVDDERILRAHYSRGFTYLAGVIEIVSLDEPAVRTAAEAMFRRMDQGLVWNSPEVSPGMKRLYADVCGLDLGSPRRLPYLKGLLREGAYSLRNNGPAYALETTLGFMSRRDAREGRGRKGRNA